jgi:hypothetical protein
MEGRLFHQIEKKIGDNLTSRNAKEGNPFSEEILKKATEKLMFEIVGASQQVQPLIAAIFKRCEEIGLSDEDVLAILKDMKRP